jgi:predicted RNA-binding Zn-ribbon protein involved in translation (DUF1610 family)
MSSDYDRDLVDSAFIHIKAKEFDAARRYLERALDIADDPDTHARASWLLSQITDDPARKRSLLEDVLSYNRNDPQARRALAILDGKLKPDEIIDADRLAPAAEGEVQPAQANRFACPNCGARMVFSPDGQSLLCENCGYHEGQSPLTDPSAPARGAKGRAQPGERDFVLAMATLAGHRKPVAMHAFTCRGCGASLILPPEAISATCSYCGTPHVVDLSASRELIEPDAIIPFAFDQARAESLLSNWIRQQGGPAPRSAAHPRGIYLPVWTFDMSGDVPFQATIEEKRGNDTVVHVIHDSYPVLYNKVTVPATNKLGSLLGTALSDYRLGEAIAYGPRYLADWPAEVYQISMADASLEARARSLQRLNGQIADYLSVNYDGYSAVTTSPAVLSTESFKLVLIPAWISNLRIGAQLRPVLVNGQTGFVHTEESKKSPLDWLGKLFK